MVSKVSSSKRPQNLSGKIKIEIDLEKIQEEFLQFAPAYVRGPGAIAIQNLIKMNQQNLVPDGLYYLVLTDLVGSTEFAKKHGNSKLTDRIKNFIHSSVMAMNTFRLRSKGLFIKEIGDAVLFLFSNFRDILEWNVNFRGLLALFPKQERILTRTIVHLGEVGLQGANPIGLSVSQTFKIEKSIPDNSITLSEPAFFAAYPGISRAYHGFAKVGEVPVQGFSGNIGLHQLVFKDDSELKIILDE